MENDRDRPGESGSRIWTLANVLTLCRIAMTAPFVYFISSNQFGIAAIVLFIAGITDYLDGYVARAFKQQSRLGQFLDPAADKLLVTAAFVALALPRENFSSIPVWLAAAVVARDLVIVLGSLLVYMSTGFKDFKPTQSSKINTTLELGLVVGFLVFHTANVLIGILPVLYAAVTVSLVISGGEYVVQGARILQAHREKAG